MELGKNHLGIVKQLGMTLKEHKKNWKMQLLAGFIKSVFPVPYNQEIKLLPEPEPEKRD